MLYATYTLGACLLCQVSQKSVRGISTYLGISTKTVQIMHQMKAGLNGGEFATFRRFPKSFYHSCILQMTFTHSTTGYTQVDLRDFEKNMKTCESVKCNAELF